MEVKEKSALKILFLEDNPFDVNLALRELKKDTLLFTPCITSNRKDFIEALDQFQPDLVVADHSLPDINSLEALEIMKDKNLEIPFILFTGSVSEEFAVSCMKAGVDDYILKDRILMLPSSIKGAMKRWNMKKESENTDELNKKLQQTLDKLNQKKEELNSSIRYARKIQDVILPRPETLYKDLKDSFILYQPKDVVSGDFYWFTHISNKLILAVGDCTGHGVPGAFMSIIGHNALNEIVINRQITTPSDILRALSFHISSLLRQDDNEAEISDGMEIGICAIHQESGIVEFSGARRPLLLFRDGEPEIIEGSKNGIGGLRLTASVDFVNHNIRCKSKDSLYLYSDGFYDQFGGIYSKKVMKRNFIKLLKDIQELDMPEQKDFLVKWLN